jgi:uncharacterized membrane protein YqiK
VCARAYVCLQVLHQEREEDELIKQIKRKKQAELRKKRRSMTADDMQRENEKLEEVSTYRFSYLTYSSLQPKLKTVYM